MKLATLVLISSVFGFEASASTFAMIEQELNYRPDHITARFETDGNGKRAWIELTSFWADPQEAGPGYRGEVVLENLSVRRLDQKGKVELVLNTGASSVVCARSVWRDRPVNAYLLQDTGNCVLYPHLESRRTQNRSVATRRTFAVIELQVRESI